MILVKGRRIASGVAGIHPKYLITFIRAQVIADTANFEGLDCRCDIGPEVRHLKQPYLTLGLWRGANTVRFTLRIGSRQSAKIRASACLCHDLRRTGLYIRFRFPRKAQEYLRKFNTLRLAKLILVGVIIPP